jgi:ribosomal protein S18 acetylase RimI-like enzyme
MKLPDSNAIDIGPAQLADAAAILSLQRIAYQSEAKIYGDWSLSPLTQSLESLLEEFATATILKAAVGGRIVGSVWAHAVGEVCSIGRLVVHPDCQGHGLGSRLLVAIERHFPMVAKFTLFTGSKSTGNIRLYQRHGYLVVGSQQLSPTLEITYMDKLASGARPAPAN